MWTFVTTEAEWVASGAEACRHLEAGSHQSHRKRSEYATTVRDNLLGGDWLSSTEQQPSDIALSSTANVCTLAQGPNGPRTKVAFTPRKGAPDTRIKQRLEAAMSGEARLTSGRLEALSSGSVHTFFHLRDPLHQLLDCHRAADCSQDTSKDGTHEVQGSSQFPTTVQNDSSPLRSTTSGCDVRNQGLRYHVMRTV